MRVKNIAVEIKPLKTSLREFAITYKKVAAGQTLKKKDILSFGDIETMRKVLTPKRVELLKVIKHKKPGSVYALAKLARRDAKSVNTDVKVLESLGMLRAKKNRTRRRATITPQVTFDRIHLEIMI